MKHALEKLMGDCVASILNETRAGKIGR